MNQLLARYPDEIAAILAKYPDDRKRSAVMPLLYLAQRKENYVSARDLDEIAEILGITHTEVGSIVGFYTLYHDEKAGRYRIQVCTDLPCSLRGAETFLQVLSAELGIGVGQTTPDGLFTLEAVTCLAACHRAPMFQIQGDGDITYHENQTAETALLVLQALREKAAQEIPQNPQETA